MFITVEKSRKLEKRYKLDVGLHFDICVSEF